MQDQIKTLEEEIKAKQLLLAALKKEEKKSVPFSQTKFGGGVFKTIAAVCKPFNSMYNNAIDHLEHPEVIQCEKLVTNAKKLLKKAKECDREKDEKKATVITLKMADLVMTTEDFVDKHPESAEFFTFSQEEMKKEIERLRPPKNEKVVAEIQEAMLQACLILPQEQE